MLKPAALALTLMVLFSPLDALAHGNEVHHQVKDKKRQIHETKRHGVISRQQHRALDRQLKQQHRAADRGYQTAPGVVGATPYFSQSGANHINDPRINPGHNNSLGHKIRDAVVPTNTLQNGLPGTTTYPGFVGGYPGVNGNINHINNPSINPGHNNSIQHRVNDSINRGQTLIPGQQTPHIQKRSRHHRRRHHRNHHDGQHGHNNH